MYSFYLENDDIKVFMNSLLKEDTFHSFELVNCTIKKDVVINIEGTINKNWYDEEVENDFVKWDDIKKYVFEFIKGKRTPEYMKFVFSLNKNAVDKIHKNAKSCSLNIIFENDKINIITGVTPKEFSLDKSLDAAWDDNIKKFFKKMQVVQNTK